MLIRVATDADFTSDERGKVLELVREHCPIRIDPLRGGFECVPQQNVAAV